MPITKKKIIKRLYSQLLSFSLKDGLYFFKTELFNFWFSYSQKNNSMINIKNPRSKKIIPLDIIIDINNG